LIINNDEESGIISLFWRAAKLEKLPLKITDYLLIIGKLKENWVEMVIRINDIQLLRRNQEKSTLL